jgi:hypothetical protein
MPHYRKIYEQYYGVKIPKGYHIHHKDMNHGNDDPLNLEALTPDEHAQKHGLLNNFIMAQQKANDRAININRIRMIGNTHALGSRRTHSPESNAAKSSRQTGTRRAPYKMVATTRKKYFLAHETRAKMSQAQVLKRLNGKDPRLGCKHSHETKHIMSLSRIGVKRGPYKRKS